MAGMQRYPMDTLKTLLKTGCSSACAASELSFDPRPRAELLLTEFPVTIVPVITKMTARSLIRVHLG